SFDIAFEASGAPAGLSSAIAATRRLGTIVQVGMLPGPTITVAMAVINKAEHTIKGAFRFDQEIDEALTMLAATPSLGSVITHTFPLDDALEALAVAGDPAISGKVVLKLDA
ncbi:MAG: zinc-binding dehydrogenase, partial [Propionibacterium sp.]|nr:zinc-binding dehydrogenase [Propionibacterium sp.]